MSPQLIALGMLHVVPAQQPPAHDMASHTQLPPMQRWPVAQTGPPPQVQLPLLHPSATRPHDMHEPPEATHARRVGGNTQVEPEQQPLAHEVGLHPLHTPPEQLPLPHEVHAAPPVPHAEVVVPARHVVP